MSKEPENNSNNECKENLGNEKEKNFDNSTEEREKETPDEKKDDSPPTPTPQDSENIKNENTNCLEDSEKLKKSTEKSVKAKKIGKYYKAGNNIYFGSSEKKDSFLDPTKLLPEKITDFSIFKINNDISKHINILKDKQIVVLNCMNPKVLFSMGYTLVKTEEFKSYQARILSFSELNSKRDDLYLDIFLNGKIGNGKKMVILVEINKNVGFWDSILSETLYLNIIVERFRENDIKLICLVNSELITKMIGEKLKEGIFHHWNIEFLPYLLEFLLPDQVDELVREISNQREKGRWGNRDNEKEFYNLLYKLYLDGKDVFLAGVKERTGEFAEGSESFTTMKNDIKANDLFINQEPHKTVLYTATFFPKLSPIEFDLMVQFFMGDRNIPIDKITQLVTENGEIKSVITRGEKKLTNIWDEESDKILSDCNLIAVTPEDSTQIIDFSNLNFRQNLMKIFKEMHSIYLMKHFRLIQTSGFLFVPDISPIIIENLIQISIDMALLIPELYNFDWLLKFIYDIKNKFDTQHIERRIINEDFYIRVASLIREMLNHQPLKKIVNGFLEKLFADKHYEVVLKLVLKVGKQLLFSSNFDFDMFGWFKRIINDGKEDIKMETYHSILQLTKERDFHILEILDIIRKWLPDEKIEPEKYSYSNIYSLLFIIEYSLKTLALLNERHYGEWPSKYPLFYALYNDKSLIEERVKILIDWLLHPGIETAIKNMKDKRNEDDILDDFDINLFIANLLEQWGIVLLGQEFQYSNSEAQELFEIIIRQITITAEKDSLRKILNWMAEIRVYYRDEISNRKYINKEIRQSIIIRYHLSRQIFTLFTKFISKTKGVLK